MLKFLVIDHRIKGWFGLGGTLKISNSNPLSMGRDTFQCPRWLQALSNLALDTSRDGESTTSWENCSSSSLPSRDGPTIPSIAEPTAPAGGGQSFGRMAEEERLKVRQWFQEGLGTPAGRSSSRLSPLKFCHRCNSTPIGTSPLEQLLHVAHAGEFGF